MKLTQHTEFEGRRANEEVLVCTHRHWLFLLPDVLVTFLLILLPIGALILATSAGAEPFDGDTRAVVAVLLPAWYLALTTFFFIRWLDFYLDLAVVTEERVIDVDQFGLFRRNVSELNYDAVQDVTTHKAGILPTLFNFGDVRIQTAGETPNFTFRAVPRPEDIVKKINEAQIASQQKEEKAAENLSEAAEKMTEAAEKIEEVAPETPDEPTSTAPEKPAAKPASAPPPESDGDLPKEYER